MRAEDQEGMDRYILQRDAPGCKAGAVFVHDRNDRVRGSIMEGCLKLAWTKEGDVQREAGVVGGAIVFHADTRHDIEWFLPEKEHRRLQKKSSHRRWYERMP